MSQKKRLAHEKHRKHIDDWIGKYRILQIVCIAAILLMPVAIYVSSVDLITAYQSASWPVALATITNSSYDISHVRDRKPYRMKIEYNYFAVSRSYTCDRISISRNDRSLASSTEADELCNRYPLGSEHWVAYNPRDPSVAYLVPGLNASHFYWVAIWVFYLPAAVCGLCAATIKRRKLIRELAEDTRQHAAPVKLA